MRPWSGGFVGLLECNGTRPQTFRKEVEARLTKGALSKESLTVPAIHPGTTRVPDGWGRLR
ncbi:hypothetical protein PLANTIT3_60963 [Plantibacter sp. T3]|nr:hypothetical protein PLANTIT3_60963 [Plantibacter sp. T3]